MGAGVLLLPHVSLFVAHQVSSLGKSLFTLRAGKGPISCVDSTVIVQATRMGEGLVTEGAGKWLTSCVCPLVNLHVSRLGESLVTLGAGIRFLSGMDSHVPLQGL